MKRFFGHRFLQNKWVVPVAALVLTLCIGSFALAGTGSGDPYSYTPPSTSSTTSVTQAVVNSSSSTTSLPILQLPTVDTATVAPTVTVAPATLAELQLQQAKENAILDLIREKMSADDQTMFDQLRALAGQQQVALSKAEADLQATKAQITALISRYLGLPSGVSVDPVAGTTTSMARINSIPQN